MFGSSLVARINIRKILVWRRIKIRRSGRHGPHPNYTDQIRNHLEWWKNQKSIINGEEVINSSLSSQQTALYMQGLVNNIKSTINSTSDRINMLNLGLAQ